MIAIVIINLTIAYSAFGTNMLISDVGAVVRVVEDIRITDFAIDSVTSSGVSSYEEFNYNLVSSKVSLPNEDSSVTYKVSITNYGSMFNRVPSTINILVKDTTQKTWLTDKFTNLTNITTLE